MKKYPLKMRPAFKDYIWGGSRFVSEYNKESDLPIIAESWEVSAHPDGLSYVANGALAGQSLKAVLELYPEWMGDKEQSELPVLIKLIDANQKLSLQVHPSDEYAYANEGQAGKNEIWYIVDAEPGAELILGFNKPYSKAELGQLLHGGGFLSAVRHIPVKAGECYNIPAGLLHGIGADLLIVEIQQSSNVTYRVFDYGRKDGEGRSRELHLDKALDVLDTSINAIKPESDVLADWEFFKCRFIRVDGCLDMFRSEDSFECLVVVDGEVTLVFGGEDLHLKKCESVFIPDGMGEYRLVAINSAKVISTVM